MRRRIIVLLALAMIGIGSFAQSFRAYVQVTYTPLVRTVSITIGDTVVVPKDSNGKAKEFSTLVAVLNWMSQKGWHLEPIDVNSKGNGNQTVLMSRENTTEKELKTMFK